MKASLLMSAVLATGPDTSIFEFGLKNTPLGLTRDNIAVGGQRANICEGFMSLIRFSVIEED